MIPVEADPTTLLKEYADSSMAVGMQALKDGKGDAFVSAGSTGALVVGASLIVKRLKGVRRTAIPTIIPSEKAMLHADRFGRQRRVQQRHAAAKFGLMGSVYMQKIMGMSSPRVGLINIGTEERKGLDVHRETYHKLQNAPVNFIGNVEARGLPLGECDVAVCRRLHRQRCPQADRGHGQILLPHAQRYAAELDQNQDRGAAAQGWGAGV